MSDFNRDNSATIQRLLNRITELETRLRRVEGIVYNASKLGWCEQDHRVLEECLHIIASPGHQRRLQEETR
jgi:hypothetical protein